MKQLLEPNLDDVRLECVLMQAWKKVSTYLRYHSWYADTLGMDYQALRIPQFIGEIQDALEAHGDWQPDPLDLVIAPKKQNWILKHDEWMPEKSKKGQNKLRPLAHVSLRDQVVSTAIMLCLADRVETKLGDPRLPFDTLENRRRVLCYGHRLVCDYTIDGKRLRHRWGSSKLYRKYFVDYQTFLQRPLNVVTRLGKTRNGTEIAIVQCDISKFYDRIRPNLLQKKIGQLMKQGDDSRFFELAARVFDWQWAKRKKAIKFANQHEIPDFMRVALPQGLVASGFFANVVMQDLEGRIRETIGKGIDKEHSITLIDCAYYVDDFRFVLQIPEGLYEANVRQIITKWIQEQINDTAPGLVIEESKTIITVQGREQQFLVPQSSAAKRIQSDVSGAIDLLHGTELIGAIEGFFHTQKRYSPEEHAKRQDEGTGLLLGCSDMQDETATRFAAYRFRRTFRSLRPMLEKEVSIKTSDFCPSETRADKSPKELCQQDLVLSKTQLDERAKLFAALLIEEWTANPANVRLLRIALDMYPDARFLSEVLRILKPCWHSGEMSEYRREVQVYCLAEVFRAGAIETGIVEDDEYLPESISVSDYHKALIEEAQGIFNSYVDSSSDIPWYLMQQVFLYLATRNSFPEGLSRLGGKGGSILSQYRRFAKFLSGGLKESTEEYAIFLVIASTAFNHKGIVEQVARRGVSPQLLVKVNECSPNTAGELWDIVHRDASEKLIKTAKGIGLQSDSNKKAITLLPELANRTINPFYNEMNLLHLAKWLFMRPDDLFGKDKAFSPWQIGCVLEDHQDEFGRISSDSIQYLMSSKINPKWFTIPSWCVNHKDCKLFQIGNLLRFAISGTTNLYSGNSQLRTKISHQYTRPISHWQQQVYSGFHGRAKLGPPWIPLSSFIEDLLYALLRWPGSGVEQESRSIEKLASGVSERLDELILLYGTHSKTLFLEKRSPLPFMYKEGTRSRMLRVGIVQTVTPNLYDFKSRTNDPELINDPAFRQRHRKHLAAALAGVDQMLEVRKTHVDYGQSIDLLVLPELAVHPKDITILLEPFARKHKCIILCGMVYHNRDSANSPLINTCNWIIPDLSNRDTIHLQPPVEQGKLHLTDLEYDFTPSPVGFRPVQWLIDYEWKLNQRPLRITASVCYDATDLNLAADLRSRSDLYIICALNQDVGTFDRMSEAMHYHMYQGVLLVNNGQFGGSSFFMPFDKFYNRQIFHLHGQPQVTVAFAEISPEKLINRQQPRVIKEIKRKGDKHDDFPPLGTWKTPPGGWIPH